MNRNIIIGLVVIVVLIIGVMTFMPGPNEPAGDASAPASTETTPPTPAPAN